MPSINLSACLIDPSSPECTATKQLIKEILEAMYLSRWFKIPLLPPPPPSPFGGGPQPEPPTIWWTIASQNFLLGELLGHALGDPNPQPNTPSLINFIKRSRIQIEVINELIGRFEKATAALKAEAKNLSHGKKEA